MDNRTNFLHGTVITPEWCNAVTRPRFVDGAPQNDGELPTPSLSIMHDVQQAITASTASAIASANSALEAKIQQSYFIDPSLVDVNGSTLSDISTSKMYLQAILGGTAILFKASISLLASRTDQFVMRIPRTIPGAPEVFNNFIIGRLSYGSLCRRGILLSDPAIGVKSVDVVIDPDSLRVSSSLTFDQFIGTSKHFEIEYVCWLQ